MRRQAALIALLWSLAALATSILVLLLAATGLRIQSTIAALFLAVGFTVTALLVFPLLRNLRARFASRGLRPPFTTQWLTRAMMAVAIAGLLIARHAQRQTTSTPPSPDLVLGAAISLIWYALVTVDAYRLLRLENNQ